MKKILKTVLITSIIMLAALAGLSVYLFQEGKKVKKENQEQAMNELDMLYKGYVREQVDPDAATPITEKGENHNLRKIEYKSVKDVYRLDKSGDAKEKLDKWKKTGIHSVDDPLFVWNPYGTNQLSMYTYFETPEPYYIEYTISVADDETIPDFTRIAYSESAKKTIQEHEYQLIGFVPGKTNYLIFRLYDSKNEMVQKKTFKIDVPELKSQPAMRLKAENGSSKEEMSNGLFFVMEEGKQAGILIYDNSGILRGYIPLIAGTSGNMFVKSDGMYYKYDSNKFARLTKMGQVSNTYTVSNYVFDDGFIYNGYGQIWILAQKKGAKSGKDLLVSLNLDSGKVSLLADFKKLLPKLYKKSKNADWMDLNSLVMTGSSEVLVSSGTTSSLFHVKGLSGGKPSIDYIIGDKEIFYNTDVSYLCFDKGLGGEEAKNENEGESKMPPGTDFTPPYGISSLSMLSKNDGSSYEVMLFNSNYFDTASIKGLGSKMKPKKNGKKSFCYLLQIWPEDKKYTLSTSFEVPHSIDGGSTQQYGAHEIILSKDGHQYGEYDASGRVLFKYTYGKKKEITGVRKESMKDFWFENM